MDSDCRANDHRAKIPIKLQKTTNITKIKGWRNKKFDFEGDEIKRSEPQVNSRGALTLRCIDELTIVNENEASTSSASSNFFSKAVGQNFKAGRNPELLDNLVKKVGDPMDNAFGNSISRTGQTSCTFQQSDCTAVDTLVKKNAGSLSVNNVQITQINSKSSDLPKKKIKGTTFENPAFVSESLDEFLSGEPAMLKLNNRSSKLSIDITKSLEVEDESTVLVKNGKAGRMWSLAASTRKLLDDYGNKPRTLAEKRRMLESCNIPNKKPRKRSLNKYFDSERDDNFQRNNISGMKRVLRSSFITEDSERASRRINYSDNIDGVDRNNITDMKRILRSSFITEDSERASRRINYSDNIDDSVTDDDDNDNEDGEDVIVTPSVNITKRNPSKEQLQHPDQIPYVSREHRASTKVRQRVKRKGKVVTPVFVRPLNRRILFEFMQLLKREEIVTASMRPPDIRTGVGMLLFAGVGRCLYQEQFENIEMMRRNNCIIDKGFAHFATSTVLDRERPKRVNRFLLPVVTTELLTFMLKYHVIQAQFKNFLINKYKINTPYASLESSSSDLANPAATKQLSNSSTECRTVDNITSPSEIKHSISCAQKSNSPVYRKELNDMIVDESSSNIEDTNAITLEQEISIPVDDKKSRNVAETENSKTSPTSDIKFKKHFLKNRRIFHEDEKMKKLHYELRRLNHAFLEVDDTESVPNSKDVSNIMIPHNVVMSNKLARVESEFHQTIMKANKDLVFLSSFGERSRRHKKLPKKLEDTVLSDALPLINTRNQKKSEILVSPDACRETKTSVSKEENLLPRVVQSEPQKPHSNGKPKLPLINTKHQKKSEILVSPDVCRETKTSVSKEENLPPRVIQSESQKPHSNGKPKLSEDFVNKTNLGRTVKDLCQKETVVVQTARSILKKSSNGTRDINSLTGRVKIDLRRFNKTPVVRLTRLTNVNSSRIWCMKHNMYRCPCLDFRSQFIAAMKTLYPAFEKTDFINGLKSTKPNGLDFHRFESSGCNGEGVILTKDDGQGTMVPRIENVMSLQHDDFFKDFAQDGDSSPTMIYQNQLTVIPRVTPEFTKPVVPQDPSTVSKHMKSEYNRGTFVYKNYRFFCVLLTHSFSFIKFVGSIDLNGMTALSETGSAVYPTAGVILAYTGILNMIRESQSKQACVFQRLNKLNFDHRKFNDLQFGIYATGCNMVHFGPYTMNESHQLEAFKLGQGVASAAKLIPFVSPELINKHVGADFVEGYWWRVFSGRTIDANRAALEAINTKRIMPPVGSNRSLLAAKGKATGHEGSAPKPFSSSLLNCKKRNVKNDGNLAFISIGDTINRIKTNSTVAGINHFVISNGEGVPAPDTSLLFKANQKYPVLNVRNNGKLSVTYPDQTGRNVDVPVSKDVHLSHPKVQQTIKETFAQHKPLFDNCSMMMSVEKSGQVKPILLNKMKEDGDIIYYCLQDNENQVIKVKNITRSGDPKNRKTQQASGGVIITDSSVLDFGSEMSVSVSEDSNAISSNSQSNLISNDVEIFYPEDNTDVCTARTSESISNAVEGNSVSISKVHLSNVNEKTKPTKRSQKLGRSSPPRKLKPASNIDFENRGDNTNVKTYPGMSVPSSKCNTSNSGVLTITKDILPKQSSNGTNSSVGRMLQQVFKKKMKQSEQSTSITSAILEKNSLTNTYKNRMVESLIKENSLLSVLKMCESTTKKSENVSNAVSKDVSLSSETAQGAVACSSLVLEDIDKAARRTERESQLESDPCEDETDKGLLLKLILKHKRRAKSNSAVPSRSDTIDLNLLVAALNKKVSEKRNKLFGATSPNEKASSSTNKLTRAVEAWKSDLKSTPRFSNLILWDSSKQCFTVNKNIKTTGPVSLSKLGSALSSLPVSSSSSVSVELVSSDTIEKYVSGEKLFSNNNTKKSGNVNGDDKVADKAVSNETVESIACISDQVQSPGVKNSEPRNGNVNGDDKIADKAVSNETVESVACISDQVQCPGVKNKNSEPRNESNVVRDENIQLGDSRSSIADNILGEVVSPVSESKHSFKLPLLQRTMLKLVNEAESGSPSISTNHRTDESSFCEGLKLVSNIDSLPSFLESYGIHFTDDSI